jgi:hypothetical protein
LVHSLVEISTNLGNVSWMLGKRSIQRWRNHLDKIRKIINEPHQKFIEQVLLVKLGADGTGMVLLSVSDSCYVQTLGCSDGRGHRAKPAGNLQLKSPNGCKAQSKALLLWLWRGWAVVRNPTVGTGFGT